MAWATDELLTDIRLRGSIPSADARFPDATLLAIATREMRERIVPLIIREQAEHLVYDYSQSVVSGTTGYRMPVRSVTGKLRDVIWVGSDSRERSLRELSPDDVDARNLSSGTPSSYYLRNFTVNLVPTPNLTGTLKTPYYARPNKLVLLSAVGTISSINTGSGAITLAATKPSTFTTSVTYDLVRGTPGFETLALDLTASAATGSTVTLSPTALPSDLAAGDYVCLSLESPVPQLPVELHSLLALLSAITALKSVGEWDAASALKEEATELGSTAIAYLSPRVDGEPKIIGNAFTGLLGPTGWRWGQ